MWPQQLSSRHGERDTRRAGAAGELTGATRPWQFGDTEPWNVTRTLTNAVLRQSGTGVTETPIHITVDDVEVSETETRAQAAVALLVDTSFSMVMENRWLPMKRTALALNHLVSTRFRSDALQIIAFGRYARTVTPAELTGLEGVYEQGTNLHHALALAGRHLRRHPNAQPVVLVVTDGEPTAHLENFGDGRRHVGVLRLPPASADDRPHRKGFRRHGPIGCAGHHLPARQRSRPRQVHRPGGASGRGPGGGTRSGRAGRRGRRRLSTFTTSLISRSPRTPNSSGAICISRATSGLPCATVRWTKWIAGSPERNLEAKHRRMSEGSRRTRTVIGGLAAGGARWRHSRRRVWQVRSLMPTTRRTAYGRG